jgi:hypothetical protein
VRRLLSILAVMSRRRPKQADDIVDGLLSLPEVPSYWELTDRADRAPSIERRLLSLLYRTLRADDTESIQARRQELVELFESLTYEQAKHLLPRLERAGTGRPAGDLHPHFKRRLATGTRTYLRRVLKKTIEEGAATDSRSEERGVRDRGASARGTEPDGAIAGVRQPTATTRGTRPADSNEASRGPGLALEFARVYKSVKLRLSAKYVDVFVYLKAKPALTITTGTGRTKAGLSTGSTEPRSSPGGGLSSKQGTALAETVVGELLDGWLTTKVKVEGAALDAKSGTGIAPKLSIKFGHDLLSIQLSRNPLTPVSVVSKVFPVKVDEHLSSVGVRVTGKVELELNVEFWPNYGAIAAEPGARKLVYEFTVKVGGKLKGGLVTMGRSASLTVVRFGGRVGGYIPSIARQGAKAAGTAGRGVSRAARYAARGLGVAAQFISGAGLVVDALIFPFEVLLRVRGARKQGIAKGHVGSFKAGYADELRALTDESWRRWFELRLEGPYTQPRAWQERPPGADEQLESWLERGAGAVEVEEHVKLAEVDWVRKYSDSERVQVAVTSRTAAAETVREIARDEAFTAGRAAAVQDILRFVVAASHDIAAADDAGTISTSGMKAWDGVARFHRRVYGTDGTERSKTYVERVTVEEVTLAPFYEN